MLQAGLIVWDATSMKKIKSLSFHAHGVSALAFSPGTLTGFGSAFVWKSYAYTMHFSRWQAACLRWSRRLANACRLGLEGRNFGVSTLSFYDSMTFFVNLCCVLLGWPARCSVQRRGAPGTPSFATFVTS